MASTYLFQFLAWLLVFSAALRILVWMSHRWSLSKRKRLPYPPGPKPTLFIGNIKDFPTRQPWITFNEWRKLYGDIIHLELLGQHYIILNSSEAARELLEKRSSIYSDRPRYVLVETMRFQTNTAFLPYGAAWRRHREMFQKSIVRENGLHSLRPIHVKKVKDLLNNLLTSPDGFIEHNKTFSASVIMAVFYGHDIALRSDPFVEISEVVMKKTSDILVSKASLITNAVPLLRFIPSWLPGTSAKRQALQGRDEVTRMYDLPFKMVKKQMETGAANPSVVSNLLQNCDSEDTNLIKEMAGTAYGAGYDTTAATLGIFFYAMLTHPAIQAKAQREIDAVVGPDYLPTFENRESLPYIGAILKEILRWRPVAPLGLHRRVNEDDIYKSYHIPKGANIIYNIWAINHDPNIFPNPEKFIPERFLNEKGAIRDDLDHEIRTFGFGRRVCSGQYLAAEVLWLSMASILHTFNITPKKAPSGCNIIPEAQYDEGTLIHILPFECCITPRSKLSEDLIRANTV